MIPIELWTALMLGFAGSWHCVGMCGPIALALPYQGMQRWQIVGNVLLYNLGRISTYSLIGMLIGLMGRALWVAGIQQYVAIGLGILFLLAAFFSLNPETYINRIPLMRKLNTWVQKQLGQFLKRDRWYNFMGIGLLNGLLPCGLVYFAIAGALSSEGVLSAGLFMMFFGLGTLPLMILTALGGQLLSAGFRRKVRKVLPLFLIFFALFFLARGFNFEPPKEIKFWETWQNPPMCH